MGEMIEGQPSKVITQKPLSRFPRWLVAVLVGTGCIVLAIFSIRINPIGYYSVKSVTVSGGLEGRQPVDVKTVFKPSETIICTVETTGIDDLTINMRWYFGDTFIYEQAGKTDNNAVSTAIRSNKNAILPEGKYHVDALMYGKVFETEYFEVKAYHPTVKPPIAIPRGHKNIELPWFPEVPFAFDETWTIDGTQWKVNEVKVVLRDDTPEYFVSVVVETTKNELSSLSESEAKIMTRPLALYTLEDGYVKQARALEIDGKYYDLNQYVIVTLVNPVSQQAYRVKFTISDLSELSQ